MIEFQVMECDQFGYIFSFGLLNFFIWFFQSYLRLDGEKYSDSRSYILKMVEFFEFSKNCVENGFC